MTRRASTPTTEPPPEELRLSPPPADGDKQPDGRPVWPRPTALSELQAHLHEAKLLLWYRVQQGLYQSQAAAVAAVAAWDHLAKCERLVAKHLSQLPLPPTGEEPGEDGND